MHNKMAINAYLPAIEFKKLSKQEQRQNHVYGEHFDVFQPEGIWGDG